MIRKVKFLGVCVKDQDRALKFYLDVLGFTLVTDQPMGPGKRWIEVKPPKGETGIALFTPDGQEDRIGTFVNSSWECDDLERIGPGSLLESADNFNRGLQLVVPALPEGLGRPGNFNVRLDPASLI